MTWRKAWVFAGLFVAGIGIGLYAPGVRRRTPAAAVVAGPAGVPAGAMPATRPARPVGAGGHALPRAGEVRDLTILQLGNFTYDPLSGGNVPEDVARLDGMTVRLTGFMVPSDEAREVTRFEMVPCLNTCCFGRPPGVQQTVLVTCDTGRPAAYCSGAVVVQGRLSVREIRDGGDVVSLFQVYGPAVAAAATPAR